MRPEMFLGKALPSRAQNLIPRRILLQTLTSGESTLSLGQLKHMGQGPDDFGTYRTYRYL